MTSTRQTKAARVAAFLLAAAGAVGASAQEPAAPAVTAPAATSIDAAASANGVEARFDSLDGTALSARIFLPAQQPVRGTVVALHGCGGLFVLQGPRAGALGGRERAMGEMLQARGYAVVFPDSFNPRGQPQVCTLPSGARRTTPGMRAADALAAMAWAARQPWGEGAPVALLGWSHGGSTLLEAIDHRRPQVRDLPVRPRVAVGFYPGCGGLQRGGWRTETPLVLMLAELDDWTAPGPCVSLGEAARAEVHVYEGSYHGFDGPGSRVVHRTDVPHGVHPGQGVHVGPNPVARQQAYERLLQVLDEKLR